MSLNISKIQHLNISQQLRKMAFYKPQTGILHICSIRITLQNRFLTHMHDTYGIIISITHYQLHEQKKKANPSGALFNCLDVLYISIPFRVITYERGQITFD